MSCKTLIDDVQQLNQTIEYEHNTNTIDRIQELNQRYIIKKKKKKKSNQI